MLTYGIDDTMVSLVPRAGKGTIGIAFALVWIARVANRVAGR